MWLILPIRFTSEMVKKHHLPWWTIWSCYGELITAVPSRSKRWRNTTYHGQLFDSHPLCLSKRWLCSKLETTTGRRQDDDKTTKMVGQLKIRLKPENCHFLVYLKWPIIEKIWKLNYFRRWVDLQNLLDKLIYHYLLHIYHNLNIYLVHYTFLEILYPLQ